MEPEDRFWDLAEPLLLTRVGVTRSTMMGYPCLRINAVAARASRGNVRPRWKEA
jgi:hypothetical protein